MTLAELVASRADEMGKYHGGSTAAGYGDSATEWDALDHGAALLDRTYRRVIRATGEDRRQYLKGQLSSDAESLVPGDGQAALLLNAQGRVQSMLSLYDRGESFDLVIDSDLLDATQERLDQFLVADDVEFEQADAPAAIQLGVGGPKAESILGKVGLQVPATPWGVCEGTVGGSACTVYARADLRVPVYEIACADADAAGLWAALEEAGATPCGFQVVETVRVESGTARFGVDVGPERIAMEARLEWAIHFAKGCYVGQEVIERAVSRGRLNRVLCQLELEGVAALGALVEGAGEKDVVTSLARSPRLGSIALAYVDRDRAVAGVRLHVGGVAARVLEWPRREILTGRR